MNFNSQKTAVWIVEEGQPKLIWKDDLTEDMQLLDLSLTTINSALYYRLKDEVTGEKFNSYYNMLSEQGDIYNEIIENKYNDFYQQALQEKEENDEIVIEDRVQELVDEAVHEQLLIKVEELILEETDNRLNKIKNENSQKLKLLSQANPVSIDTELVDNIIKEDKFINSTDYVPDFLRDKPLFKDVTKLLNVLLNTETFEETLDVLKSEYEQQLSEVTDENERKNIISKYNARIYELSKHYNDTLKPINEAYIDTLCKYPGYSRLSYDTRITLLTEKGFGYIVDLLTHMYDEEYDQLVDKAKAEGTLDELQSYEDFVKEQTDESLANITMLFNLLNTLKGKTLGLELALQLTKVPGYVYIPWNIVSNVKGEWTGDLPLPGGSTVVRKGDCYSQTVGNTTTWYMFNGVSWHVIDDPDAYKRKRERFTAVLDVYGLETNSHRVDLQKRISNFVRSYMLPHINVTVRYTHSVQPIICKASWGKNLLNMIIADENGTGNQKLIHKMSDEGWSYTNLFDRCQLNFGKPSFSQPYQGSVILSKSYVQDPDGTKHYLYGAKPTFANLVSGDAMSKATEQGIINNYENDYLQVPLQKRVDVDIMTGEQINPHWEGNTFYRDTVIKFYQTLIIEGIHLTRTVEEMTSYETNGEVDDESNLPQNANIGDCYQIINTKDRFLYNGEWVKLSYPDLLIEDFEKQYEKAEVWLGRKTELSLESGYNHNIDKETRKTNLYNKYKDNLESQGITGVELQENLKAAQSYLELYDKINSDDSLYIRESAQKELDDLINKYPDLTYLSTYHNFYEFTTSNYEVREYTGNEDTHLVFCEEKLDDNYTGIGDLGILGANDYFIYNGMLIHHGNKLLQVGEDKTWTDVGASHATSEIYYTPAINNGSLKCIFNGEIYDVHRDLNHLENYKSHTTYHPQVIVETLDENEKVEELEKEQIRAFEGPWYEIDEYWNPIESSRWTHITGFINEYYTAFGICDERLYKIYLNPLYGIEDEPLLCYQLMEDEQRWTYITGASYSGTYEAYGIKNKRLYRISSDSINEMKLEDVNTITGLNHISYINNVLTYDTLEGQDTLELVYKDLIIEGDIILDENDNPIQVLDKVIFNGQENILNQEENIYTCEGITINYDEQLQSIFIETELYNAYITFDPQLKSFTLNQRHEIIGWVDKISRYHHNNSDYITYGICKGELYAINNKSIKMIDDSRIYTDVCGFYNDKSARTVAFALSNKKLYKIENETISLFDNRDWDEIHGCTVTYNTYVLGRSEGKIYKINARDIISLDDRQDWISIYGRSTSSNTDISNCYGYAIRQTSQGKKLYEITRSGINIISGFWKIDGTGQIQDLANYNIDNIKACIPDITGTAVITTFNNEQEIKENAVYGNTLLNDYDIYVSYKTTGFNNNERYTIRSIINDVNYVYIHPSECRYKIYEDNCYDLFDTNTGLMTGFIQRNVQENGVDIIAGDGTATRFKETNTYLILPEVSNLSQIIIKASCVLSNGMNPIVLDDNNCGVYYGYDGNSYGLFIMHNENGINKTKLAIEGNEGSIINANIIYSIQENISININGLNQFESSSLNNDFVYIPKYLGGNGTIFGDSTIYLKQSSMVGDKTINLFENGKYISVDTIYKQNKGQDVVLKVKTNTTQDIQKVIEIQGNETYELRMDELYSQLDVECPTNDLIVSTDYNNQMQHDPYEGISYSTITYKGDYQLDPQKIVENESGIHLNDLCDFATTGIGSNINNDYNLSFKLSADNHEIKIKSGQIVENQRLFRTEENEAYTNKYLLESHISAISDVECDTVPSGIIYELNTDKPQVITRTLTFNNDHFDIDTTKISDYSYYWYDSYNALLHLSPKYDYDYLTGESTYVDTGVSIKLDLSNPTIGNVKTNSNKIKINSPTDEELKLFTIDETVFNINEMGSLYYKIDTVQTFINYNNEVISEINNSTHDVDKDKLIYEDGKCTNYSKWRYHSLNEPINKLILCITNNDDTSKNQCILGSTNSFGIVDNEWAISLNGTILKSGITAQDSTTYYLKFENNRIDYSMNGKNWIQLFENISFNDCTLGYGKMTESSWSYDGTIDLSRSILNNKRLYNMTQDTIVYKSQDNEAFELINTVTTNYTVDEIILGYQFYGTLDMYDSNLLMSYDLDWVENRTLLDQVIKSDIAAVDSSYDPEMDQNIYDITEYGILLNGTPKRWDTIAVTYTTIDKAFYMQPNTEYTLKMIVEDDNESGTTLMNIINEPTFNLGNVSNFENGYVTYNLTNEEYIVIKFNLSGNNEPLCCYLENDILEENNTSPRIFVENNKVKFYHDNIIDELFDVEQDNYYIKLYNSSNYIEYSKDGQNFIQTNIERSFTGYAPIAFGVSYNDFFKGSIDLKDSYIFKDNKQDLFKYYKKIYTYINDGQDHELTLEPLLTIRDYVDFAPAFDGSIYFYESGLCLPNTRHWMANQIKIYENGNLIDTVIRDELNLDSIYTLQNEEVIVDLNNLHVQIEGAPEIGSQLLLTYNSWYLFRKKNTDYEFNVRYNDKVTISWNEKDGTEHLIMYLPSQPLLVNFGYEFNGTLSLIDSTRDQMALCDYLSYYTYSIQYKKANEDNWHLWYEWVMEKANRLYERIGYSLKGIHYLETSIIETDEITTPFITFFDPEYVRPIGNVSFSTDHTGEVTNFSDDNYLKMEMDKLQEGSTVSFLIHTANDISDQGVATFVKIRRGYFQDGNNQDLKEIPKKAKKNYTYILEYQFGGGALNVETVNRMSLEDLELLEIRKFEDATDKIVARMLGYNVGDWVQLSKPSTKMVTIIPYKKVNDKNVYPTESDIQNIKVYYRKVTKEPYDHYTHTGNVEWIQTELIQGSIQYFDELLNVYYVKVPFGYNVLNGQYVNQGQIEYNTGDVIEFKVVANNTSYTQIIPYTNMIKLHKISF